MIRLIRELPLLFYLIYIYMLKYLFLQEKVSNKLSVDKPNKSKACCAPFYHALLQNVCKLQQSTEAASEPKREIFLFKN